MISEKQINDWLALYDRMIANPNDPTEADAWFIVVTMKFKELAQELLQLRQQLTEKDKEIKEWKTHVKLLNETLRNALTE
ncbi:MAG TPA: hypothetical protein VMW53_07380 [archaeon]|nr:hypothetical protein [archaeon]